MTRILISILVLVSVLACSFSAVNTPAANSHFAAEVITSPVPPKNKPDNAPDSAYPYQTVVTAELLNVRTGAGHKHELVPSVWLIRGESVTVSQCVGVWAKVGNGRWVNSRYLERMCK